MNNNNNNNANIVAVANTSVFNYEIAKVNPKVLESHPILGELGFSNKADDRYNEMMNYFRHYDRPVLIDENKVVLHWPDVQAAVQNGETEIECYHAKMTKQQIMQFILMKHKYHRQSLIVGYNSVKFYEDYLKNHPDGIELTNTMTGTTRKKIADLMYTSDSTIKRLMEVGRNKPEKLGLIEEGYTSFKQVSAEIKAEELAAGTARNKEEADRKAAQEASTPSPAPEKEQVYYVEPDEDNVADGDPGLQDEYYTETEPEKPIDVVGAGTNTTEKYYEESEDSIISANVPFKFEQGQFTIGGLGKLEVSITDNIATLTINGIEVGNMSYMPVVNRESNGEISQSFVLYQEKNNGMSIHLTIENFKKAA